MIQNTGAKILFFALLPKFPEPLNPMKRKLLSFLIQTLVFSAFALVIYFVAFRSQL